MELNDILSKTKPIVCEQCGCQTFTEGVILRKVSRILTGDTKDSVYPIPVFTCSKCGHVNKEFIPTILQEESKEAEKKSSLITNP